MERATVEEALRWARDRLRAAGVDAPQLDARLLLTEATGWPVGTLIGHPDRVVPDEVMPRFCAMVERRAGREPVSHILGRRGFWTQDFVVGPDVLDPRPDSETLVELALRHVAVDATGLVVDLGTGSGCLLYSLLTERPGMTGLGVDFSMAALRIAVVNRERLALTNRCHLLCGDWADAIEDGVADLVIANPPYIVSNVLAGLEDEVRCFDPALALDGGADGLDAYRRIAPQLARMLRNTGVAVVEIGYDQSSAVAGLLAEQGLHVAAPVQDLGGRDRCLLATPAAL